MLANLKFYGYRFGNRHAVRCKNVAGLSVIVPGLSVSVRGLSVIIYGLSVSLSGLLNEKVPNSRTQTLKVPDWPGKVTGLSGTYTDRLAKVTYCMVIFSPRSLFVITYSLDKHILDKPDA